MTQNMLRMIADLIPSIFLWFHCDYANFSTLLKRDFFVFFTTSFHNFKKRLQKPNILLNL
jgi:hypothetical protein